MPNREEMNDILDKQRDCLVDDFARMIGLLNERNYTEAALFMFNLGNALTILSAGVASEALVRRVEDMEQRLRDNGLDTPE